MSDVYYSKMAACTSIHPQFNYANTQLDTKSGRLKGTSYITIHPWFC